MLDDDDIYDWLQSASDGYGMERCLEAADTIWKLRVEAHQFRRALRQIAGKVSQTDKSFDGDMASDIARAALGEGKE